MVFKWKLEGMGNLCFFKTSLVEKVFLQMKNVDYPEPFPPVVTFEVVILFSGKSVTDGWHVHLTDNSSKCLNG